jgi:hypothetical protein
MTASRTVSTRSCLALRPVLQGGPRCASCTTPTIDCGGAKRFLRRSAQCCDFSGRRRVTNAPSHNQKRHSRCRRSGRDADRVHLRLARLPEHRRSGTGVHSRNTRVQCGLRRTCSRHSGSRQERFDALLARDRLRPPHCSYFFGCGGESFLEHLLVRFIQLLHVVLLSV